MAHFKRGEFSTCEAPLSERPNRVTTPEIMVQIHELILVNTRISAKSVSEHLGISREWVGSVIHADVDMQNLSVKWVPKCLEAYQNLQRFQTYE